MRLCFVYRNWKIIEFFRVRGYHGIPCLDLPVKVNIFGSISHGKEWKLSLASTAIARSFESGERVL